MASKTTGMKIIRKKGFKTADPEKEQNKEESKSYIPTERRKNQLKELYNSIDTAKTQKLNIADIQKLFLLIERELTDKEIKQWLEPLGKNYFDFHDFYQYELFLLQQEQLEENLEEAEYAFQTYDENEMGFITVEELKKILMESGNDSENFSNEEFKKVLDLADLREDGIFCYQKFIKEVRKTHNI